jgi:hypothetical protein
MKCASWPSSLATFLHDPKKNADEAEAFHHGFGLSENSPSYDEHEHSHSCPDEERYDAPRR